jgi:hypothetical protein
MCIKINKIGKQEVGIWWVQKHFPRYGVPIWRLADFVDFYTHLTYICICTFFVAFFPATIDGRHLIFGHKLHIGTPYRGKRFWTRQIPTSCLPKSGGIISDQRVKSMWYTSVLIFLGHWCCHNWWNTLWLLWVRCLIVYDPTSTRWTV